MRHNNLALNEEKLNILAFLDYTYKETNSRDIEKMKKILHKAIVTELTERQQQCIFQYYYCEKSMKQVAKELNLHPSVVTRHIQRAKEKLRRVARYY